MVRTTPSFVFTYIDQDSCVDVKPAILMASALVDWLVTQDLLGSLTTTLQKQIETLLAAHFYSLRVKQFQSKSTGKASGQYAGQTAMVLKRTSFGQDAMLLDVTNKLAQRSQEAESGFRRVAKAQWLGYASDSQRADGDNATP